MLDANKIFEPPEETAGTGQCDTHGEYRTVMVRLPGSEKAMPGPCPQCSVVQLDEQRHLKAKQKMREMNRLMERSGIPKRFRTKTLDDYNPVNETQARVLAVVKKYSDNFSERYEAGGCLVLLGPSGTGKSHLSCCIANKIMEQGYTSMFTTVIEAVRLIRSTYGGKSTLTESEAIHRFTWPDLLILDEVGMQYGSDNEFLILTEIINLRYADGKPTIMLSNLPPDKFETFVGDRVFDRLHENGGLILSVPGDSYRRLVG